MQLVERARGRFIPTPVGNARRPRANGSPVDGSSPRPWGTLFRDPRAARRLRFIPTSVGNATMRPPPNPWPAVHPHARGERTSSTLLIFKVNFTRSDSTDLCWSERFDC